MLKRVLFFLFLTSLLMSGYSQLNMSLVGQFSYGTTELSDIWGHVDGLGNEYAIVGKVSGTSIVDISTPSVPVEVFLSNGPLSTWRDLKVWDNHAYIVNETSGGLKIIDMSNLPGLITGTDVYQFTGVTYPFTSAHDLYIDENGFAYIMGANNGVGGAIILDLNNNPKIPVEVGRYNDFYLHDGMARGDTLWGGAVNDGFFTIIDVSNKANPITLSTQNTPSGVTHNCWISDDGHTLYTTDEVSNAFVTSYDVSDVNNIQELDRVQSNPGQGVIPHNTFVLGDYIVTSYYRDGITIHDVSNPSIMVEVANYDTSPIFTGNGFNGSWGVYPYLPSGLIIASDIENGLFILDPTYVLASFLEGNITDMATGLAIDDVHIEFLVTSDSSNSNVLGNYQMGVANSGTYDITYSKFGYESDTIFNLVLTGSNTVVQDVQLVPLGASLLGQVIEQTTLNPIANANVLISNGQLTTTLLTDSAGNFIIPNFIDGQYDISIGKWGYLTSCISNETINTANNPNVYVLEKGIYDDFIFDFGWTVSGAVTSGDWEKGEPVGTIFGGLSNPDFDALTDCGIEAFVTGNGGGTAGDDDIDGGVTILTSPIADLSIYSDPYIHFDRWFFNSGSNENDSLTIEINNGVVSKIIDFADIDDPDLGQWSTKVIRVLDFVSLTNNTTLTIRAMDVNGADIVEAGFDHFFVTEEGLVSVENVNDKGLLKIYPNPFNSEINITFNNKELEQIKIEILDLTGIIIDVRAFRNARTVRVTNNYKKGIYFMKVYGNGELIKTEKIVKL